MHERCERLSRLPAPPWLLAFSFCSHRHWARQWRRRLPCVPSEPAVVCHGCRSSHNHGRKRKCKRQKSNPDPRHVIVPPRTFTVPSVSGMSLAAAQRKITALASRPSGAGSIRRIG